MTEPNLGDYPKDGMKTLTMKLEVELMDELRRMAAQKGVSLRFLVICYLGEGLHRSKLNPS